MHVSLFDIATLGLGLIAGSFLNALSFRFNTGVSIMHGRSKCMRCGHTLSALDLIPLLSYLMLGGRCRYCGSSISFQYPLVEFVAAVLSLCVWLTAPSLLLFALGWFFWMLTLFIVIYDIRHKMIPFSCSLLLMLVSLAYLFFVRGASLNALLAGPLLAAPFLLLSLLSRQTLMGLGDGLFELSFGWLLGLFAGLTALMLAIWSGALVGVALVVWAQLPWKYGSRGFTMKSELPFAPFLALGAAAAYFLHVDLFSNLASLL